MKSTPTHAAAQPAAYTAAPTPKRPSLRKPEPGACGQTCSGGYKCASTRHPHVLHICNHIECECRWELRHSGTGVTK